MQPLPLYEILFKNGLFFFLRKGKLQDIHTSELYETMFKRAQNKLEQVSLLLWCDCSQLCGFYQTQHLSFYVVIHSLSKHPFKFPIHIVVDVS